MATSRYDTPTEAAKSIGGTTTSSGSSSGSTSGSTSGTTTSSTSGTSNTNSTTTNLSAANMGVLDNLIKQLMSGGTAEIRQQQAARNAEAGNVSNIREGYSKNNAFMDAQGLIAQTMRRALESMLPSINRAAEDAGSSGGALRALLLQDAASKASEAASAQGANQAVQYGQISASLSAVLERLKEVNPAATNALIQALNVAKGAVSKTNSTTVSDQSTVGTTQSNTSGTTNNNSNEVKTLTPSTSGGLVTTPTVSPTAMTSYYGPDAGAGPKPLPVGTTLDTLMQLAGGSNAWSDYTF